MKRLQDILYGVTLTLALCVAPMLVEAAYPAAMSAIAAAALCVVLADRIEKRRGHE